jgi:hypothetical protein
MSKRAQLIEQASELLEREHPGCDDNTCIINEEMCSRYPLNVVEQFASSGAASIKFERIRKELFGRYKKPFEALRREADKLCREVPHMTCVCNAIIWDQSGWYSEGEPVRCASCGTVSNFKSEE